MKRSAYDELLRHTMRGGRVFLFAYPEHVAAVYDATVIKQRLLELPGCIDVKFNLDAQGLTVTVNDYEDGAITISDSEYRDLIASTVFTYWREE